MSMPYKNEEDKASYTAAYYQSHKEELLAYHKAYYEDHKDELAAERSANREQVRAHARALYAANPEAAAVRRKRWNSGHRDQVLEDQKRRRRERRSYLGALKLASGCVDCGYKGHAVALDFDHLPGMGKVAQVSDLVNGDLDKLHAEIAKCEVVCANCHRVRTDSRQQAEAAACLSKTPYTADIILVVA